MVVKEELAKIVASENVTDDPDTLDQYSKDLSFVLPIRPRCVVKPNSLEEAQEIVKWANDTLTPIIPVSSGPPRFRGDTIPKIGGAVIVDLSLMKKIIRVDRRNRVAIVEPGVTFGELIPELAKEDLAPLMPLTPRQSKSVVASLLETEPITAPRYHWETQDPLRCVEIVYGTGDLFRTGSSVGPGSIEDQWKVGRTQTGPLGPSAINFAKLIQGTQGTMGIVTWASVACRPLPELKKTFFVPAVRVEDLIDFTYRLMWKKLGHECLILNRHNLACLLAEDSDSIEQLREVLPPWIVIFSIEGFGVLPKERVEYQEAEFMDVAQEFGLEPVNRLAGINGQDAAKVFSQPSKEPYWKLRLKGGCHDIFFLTTLDKTPGFIAKMFDLAYSYGYPAKHMGVYLQPTLHGTNCHCEFNLSYKSQSKEQTDKVKRFDTEASRVLVNMGGFFSRPYGSWADFAYGGSSAVTTEITKKIKGIFDPKGIMNPGKLCY